jgi:Bacterial SH3 domain
MRRVEGGRRRALRIVRAVVWMGAFALAAPGFAQDDPPTPSATSTPAPTPEPPPPLAPKPTAAPKPAPAAKPPTEIPKPTERAWVRGEVKVNYRASASPTATPIGVVTTGDEVGVIEHKNGWAHIVADENGVGWLPDMHLAAEPPPREHLELLKQQVGELQKNLDTAEREAASLRAQVAQSSGQEAERDEELRRLRDENRDLQAGERWPYMVMGAGILAIGFVVGLLFRGGGRRSSARLRY